MTCALKKRKTVTSVSELLTMITKTVLNLSHVFSHGTIPFLIMCYYEVIPNYNSVSPYVYYLAQVYLGTQFKE